MCMGMQIEPDSETELLVGVVNCSFTVLSSLRIRTKMCVQESD